LTEPSPRSAFRTRSGSRQTADPRLAGDGADTGAPVSPDRLAVARAHGPSLARAGSRRPSRPARRRSVGRRGAVPARGRPHGPRRCAVEGAGVSPSVRLSLPSPAPPRQTRFQPRGCAQAKSLRPTRRVPAQNVAPARQLEKGWRADLHPRGPIGEAPIEGWAASTAAFSLSLMSLPFVFSRKPASLLGLAISTARAISGQDHARDRARPHRDREQAAGRASSSPPRTLLPGRRNATRRAAHIRALPPNVRVQGKGKP
jgi:hypothetical protein